jgi:hypothetical protein
MGEATVMVRCECTAKYSVTVIILIVLLYFFQHSLFQSSIIDD